MPASHIDEGVAWLEIFVAASRVRARSASTWTMPERACPAPAAYETSAWLPIIRGSGIAANRFGEFLAVPAAQRFAAE